MMFVSFWATFKNDGLQSNFMGNIELPFGEISGIEDVAVAEKFIKNKLNEECVGRVAGIAVVTIINWKRFNT